MVGTFWISCFFNSCYMHLLKSLYSLSIGRLSWFFFCNTHGLSFHFYLYNVREENALHFENFEKSCFVFCLLQFCLLQFCCTIPNVCRNKLSSTVVRTNAKPKLFFIIWCVVNHDKHTLLQKYDFYWLITMQKRWM
jgi:hypothetical protein